MKILLMIAVKCARTLPVFARLKTVITPIMQVSENPYSRVFYPVELLVVDKNNAKSLNTSNCL